MSHNALSAAHRPAAAAAETTADGVAAAADPGAPAEQCLSPSPRGSCFPKPPPHGSSASPSCGDKESPDLIADGMALLARERNRGGRPTVVDDQLKGKMVILLATGLSLRQTAAFLGVTHPTVSAAIAGDKELAADIASARVRAELHPLAHVIREGGRSWKTAAWLLEYLEKRNERERKEEQRSRQQVKSSGAAPGEGSSRPAFPPLSESETSRIAAIRAQRPPRKRRAK